MHRRLLSLLIALAGLPLVLGAAAPERPDGEPARMKDPAADLAGVIQPLAPALPLGSGGGAEATPLSSRDFESGAGVDAPLARPQSFPRDLPAVEVRLGQDLPTDGARDRSVVPFARPDGRALVLAQEDLRVTAQTSSDGGVTFDPPTILPPFPELDVYTYTAVHVAGTDTVYLLVVVADPTGAYGCQLVRSDDFGASWSDPLDLVRRGDDTHGISSFALAANSGGTVAVVYREGRGDDPYARVSTDGGASFAAPVRLNSGVDIGQGDLDPLFVLVDSVGTVHVAYQEFTAFIGRVYYTNSSDGGLTFTEPTPVSDFVDNTGNTLNPELAEAPNGDILLAFWDAAGFESSRVRILSSDDGGFSFTEQLDDQFSGETALTPHLTSLPSDGVVMYHVLGPGGDVLSRRSTDDGQSWGGRVAATTSGRVATVDGVVTRSGQGIYALSFADNRDDDYTGGKQDFYVITSSDTGQSWTSEERVNTTPPGAEILQHSAKALAAVGEDDLLAAWADRRREPGAGSDVWTNRGPASPLGFEGDVRIDQDDEQREANIFSLLDVAAVEGSGDAGAARVHAAFAAPVDGSYPQIFAATSDDGGYSFGTPLEVSDAGGAVDCRLPRIEATPDGNVYVAYMCFDPTSLSWELRFNRSQDGGTTWLEDEQAFGPLVAGEFDLVAQDGGRVYLLWAENDGDNIQLARSSDGGDSFTESTVNANTDEFNRRPQGCAIDDVLFVSFLAPDQAFAFLTAQLAVSTDAGETFEPETQLLPDGADGGVSYHRTDCSRDVPSGGGETEYLWGMLAQDVRTGNSLTTAEFVRVSGGTTQQLGDFTVAPDAAFRRAADIGMEDDWQGDALMAIDEAFDPNDVDSNNTQRIRFLRYDETGNLQTETALTSDTASGDGVPLPGATSLDARLVTDGLGNVWVTWQDTSAGTQELVGRFSNDRGDTFGDVHRISRHQPQGVGVMPVNNLLTDYFQAAVDGEAFFVWAEDRTSRLFSGLLSSWDSDDFDRDQIPSGSDCDDADPSVGSSPGDVPGLGAKKLGGGNVRFSWNEPTTGADASTVYDLATGSLGVLLDSGTYDDATCLADGLADTSYEDDRPAPAPGAGTYQLVRARSDCGTGSYGDASVSPDPRDDLDASGPCP